MDGRRVGDSQQGKNGGDNLEQDLRLPGLDSRVRAMRTTIPDPQAASRKTATGIEA